MPATTAACVRVEMGPGAVTRGANTIPPLTLLRPAGAITESSAGMTCGFTDLNASSDYSLDLIGLEQDRDFPRGSEEHTL